MLARGFDVLVVGSGIAGVSAALEAAHAGARVALASVGDTFSGSSFYGGTWGLGLIGPEDESDNDDLVQTILRVGCGAADPVLAHELVAGIQPAIAWLESMGVALRTPTDAGQREYIPCFDHKSRSWHGLVRDSLRTSWSRELERRNVVCLPHTELLEIEEQEGHVAAGLLADLGRERFVRVPCGAIVLATGGLAGLFERRLTAADVCGSSQGIALAHGCSLVNAEFLQMMLGIVSPVQGVVLNEKAFRFSTLPFSNELLAKRSTYGPFTTRLASHEIDLAIAEAGPGGMALSYHLPADPPELVADYFSWLHDAFDLRPDDEVRVSLYAHASNGGIRIARDTSCVGGPIGLFACGECSGGMHGADRIGGLASASALVFGRMAGRHAAQMAERGHAPATTWVHELEHSPLADSVSHRLQAAMSAHAMVCRTEEGLGAMLRLTQELDRLLRDTLVPADAASQAVATRRLLHQLVAARAMVQAMCDRPESRGSHHRADERATSSAVRTL